MIHCRHPELLDALRALRGALDVLEDVADALGDEDASLEFDLANAVFDTHEAFIVGGELAELWRMACNEGEDAA